MIAPAQCPIVFTSTGSWMLSRSGISTLYHIQLRKSAYTSPRCPGGGIPSGFSLLINVPPRKKVFWGKKNWTKPGPAPNWLGGPLSPLGGEDLRATQTKTHAPKEKKRQSKGGSERKTPRQGEGSEYGVGHKKKQPPPPHPPPPRAKGREKKKKKTNALGTCLPTFKFKKEKERSPPNPQPRK